MPLVGGVEVVTVVEGGGVVVDVVIGSGTDVLLAVVVVVGAAVVVARCTCRAVVAVVLGADVTEVVVPDVAVAEVAFVVAEVAVVVAEVAVAERTVVVADVAVLVGVPGAIPLVDGAAPERSAVVDVVPPPPLWPGLLGLILDGASGPRAERCVTVVTTASASRWRTCDSSALIVRSREATSAFSLFRPAVLGGGDGLPPAFRTTV